MICFGDRVIHTWHCITSGLYRRPPVAGPPRPSTRTPRPTDPAPAPGLKLQMTLGVSLAFLGPVDSRSSGACSSLMVARAQPLPASRTPCREDAPEISLPTIEPPSEIGGSGGISTVNRRLIKSFATYPPWDPYEALTRCQIAALSLAIVGVSSRPLHRVIEGTQIRFGHRDATT